MMVHKKMGNFFSVTNWTDTGNNANCAANGEKKSEESPEGVVVVPEEPMAEGEAKTAEGAAAAEGEPKTEGAAEGEPKTEGAAEGEPKTEGAAEGEPKTEGAAAAEGEAKTEGAAAPAESADAQKKTRIPADQTTESTESTKSAGTEAPKVGGAAKKRRRTRRKHRAARKSSRKQ